jgi:hypothetical protein
MPRLGMAACPMVDGSRVGVGRLIGAVMGGGRWEGGKDAWLLGCGGGGIM